MANRYNFHSENDQTSTCIYTVGIRAVGTAPTSLNGIEKKEITLLCRYIVIIEKIR